VGEPGDVGRVDRIALRGEVVRAAWMYTVCHSTMTLIMMPRLSSWFSLESQQRPSGDFPNALVTM
jgi:hypothetical protein